jgi:hypothetical protein
MKREIIGAMGLALVLGFGARDAAAQAVRVDVGINAPPVAARITFGDAVYYVDRSYLVEEPVYVLPVRSPRRVVIYGPYAYRYRRYYTWVDYERARLGRLYLSSHQYRKATRAFERERARRERELQREYLHWLREHEYARGSSQGRGRGRGNGWGNGRR